MNDRGDENKPPIVRNWCRQMSLHVSPTWGYWAHLDIEGETAMVPQPSFACRRSYRLYSHQVNKGFSLCPPPPSSFRLDCISKSCFLFWQKVQVAFQQSWWVHSAVWGHTMNSFLPSRAPLGQLSHSPSTCHSWIFPSLVYTFCRAWTCLWLPVVALFWPNPCVQGGKLSSAWHGTTMFLFFPAQLFSKKCYWNMCLFAASLPLFFPANSPKLLWDLLGSFQTSLIEWKWLQT